MNKILLEKTSLNNSHRLPQKKLFLLLLFALVSLVGNAQIGPYARFESIASSIASTSGFTFTTAGVGSTAGVARSGLYYYQDGAINSCLITPAIDNPNTFSFYIKATNVLNTYSVEYSTDNFVTPIDLTTASGVSFTKPTVLSSWQLVTFTFTTPLNLSNVKFRIKDTYTRGTASTLYIDDVSWTCYVSAVSVSPPAGTVSTGYPENTVVAPVQTGNGVPVNCTGGTINVGHTDVYNFYDNGGASDQYNINQTNTVTFKPSTVDDNVRVQFISYTGAATEKIEIWDNNGAGTAANNLLTYTATTIPAVTTYISSIASDGSVTVKFTSDAATNAAGFNIKVDCTQCPKPTSLSSSSVAGYTANLNWGATTAGNYDVYYGTVSSLILPLVGTTTTTATNSLSLSTLTPGTTYYVWVRSNCGANSYSSWYGPINFTTLSCGAFLLGSSPSASNQSLCLNSASTPLTASATGGTVSTYQWYSNSSASTVGATAVGTNSSSYTPLTTVAGTLYYYCVITSSTGCTVTTGFSGGITVSALPVVTTSAASVCLGSTINVTPTSGGTWSSSDITIATVTNAGVVTGVASGSVTLTFTSSTAPNCSNTISITVNALPIVSAAAAVCIGSTIIIAPTSGGTWSSSDATKASVTNAGLVTGVAAGSATFTFLNTATNCSNTTTSVTVNALPVVSTPSTSMCVGSTITLSPTTGGTWISSDNTIATVTNAGVVTGVVAGSAAFTFLNTISNCSATTSTVTINALPVVTAGASVCIGSTITLSPTTGGTWISSSNSIATVTNLGIVTGVAVGNATFTFTNTTTSCSNTTTSVGINALPTITGTLSACTGNTTQLTGSGTAAITNPWVSSNTAVATVNSTGLVTGVTAGSTTITYTNSNGCAITASVTITATAIPTASAGTTITNTSFTANWSAASGATGYYLDVSTSNTFATFLTGYNGLSVGNVTTYGISGLTSGVTYYYRVKATGSCGISAYSGPITVTTTSTTYCTPTVNNSATYYINSFATTGGLTNITNNNTGFTAGGYANYSATISCSQYAGSAINFSIGNKDTTGTYYYYVWIDWNNDGDFLDAGETIVATTTFTAGPYSGSFTIPGGQASGAYRMRVSNSWNYANTSCTNAGNGEFEDYTVNVIALPPCALSTPSALYTTNLGPTSATVYWIDTALTVSSTYDYIISTSPGTPSPTATPTGNVVGTSTVNLTGLTLGLTYYVWVRSNCGGTYNSWVGSISFTTANIDVVNMTNGSITTCSAVFYDSGGPNNRYSKGENYVYTFNPGVSTSKIRVAFNSFSTRNGSGVLTIYNGPTTASPSLGTFSGAQIAAGQVFTSTDITGALTFQFVSDNNKTRAGWDAKVNCVTVPIVTSFTPTSICSGTSPLVTITGSNFTTATSVKCNGVAATSFTVVNNTTITATFPTTITTGLITVANPIATGYSITNFTVIPVPSAPNAGSDVSFCNGGSTVLNGTAQVGGLNNTILSQNFNSSNLPSSWTITYTYLPDLYGSYYDFYEYSGGHSGNAAFFDSFLIPDGNDGSMVSPVMNLSTYSSATLTFWLYNPDGLDTLAVYANNDGGTYTQVGATYDASYGSWTQITIALDAFTGANGDAVTIKFTGSSDYYYSISNYEDSDIGIDDILVTASSIVTNSWTSNPAGFTSSSLTPTVNPTVTTTYTLSSTYGNGCSVTDDVIVTVNQKPTLTSTLAVNALCASTSAQSASLNYTATTNSPTSYSIVWNALAHTAGFADQATTTLAFASGAGNITGITIPANVTANQYTGSLTITNANGCTSSYTITVNIGKLWNGGTSNDWGYANNWTPSGVPTSSDCVVIPSGTLNSPEISVNAFAGNLTINSSASLSVDSGVAVEVQDFVKTDGTFTMNSSASLIQINNVANSGAGNMIYKRDVTSVHGYDYIYWSSPVVAQAVSGLYSTPGIGYQYYWDTLANNNNGASGNIGQGNWANAFGVMQVGKGYIIRGSSSYNWSGNLTANFTGIPNNGDVLMSIARGSYTGAPYSGANGVTISNQEDNYNLIGNPYPSAIKATDFLNWPSNTTKIQGVVYLWTHNSTPTSNANTFYSTGHYNYFTNDYLAYNNVGASSGPGFNGYIAAGQGFFVTMLDGATDTTQSVVFNNSMRNKTYSNTNFFKGNQQATQASNEVDRIWLDLVDNNSVSTRTLIGYIDGATVNKDRQFDAYTPVGNATIIYSLVEGDSHIIQGRPLPFDTNDQVPLGYHSAASGNFTIAIATVDGLFEQGQPIYLEDKLLNVIYDLRQAPYVFTTDAGTFNDRFVLRYTSSNLSNEQFTSQSAAAFIMNQKLQIRASSLITNVQIYDVAGKLIKTYTPAVKALELIEDFPFANGVYFAKIKLDDGSQYIQKVMN